MKVPPAGADLIVLRPLQAADCEALRSLTLAAIRVSAAAHYDEAQREAWAGWVKSATSFADSLARGPVTVAQLADRVVGYTQFIRPDHLGLLYVAPAHGGCGIGRRLVEAVVAQARSAGARTVTTDASRVAKSVFEGVGFQVEATELVELAGQELERFRMALLF